MSGYTIGEIVIWLLLTAVLAFALGWMCCELLHRSRSRRTNDPTPVAPAPVVESTPAPKVAPKKTKPPKKTKQPELPELPEPVETPNEMPVETAAGAPVDTPVETPVDTPAVKSGPHPGSALPLPGGAAPSSDYVVKVSRGSKIYHEPSSPAYARTKAALWFTSAQAAEDAGFRKPKNG